MSAAALERLRTSPFRNVSLIVLAVAGNLFLRYGVDFERGEEMIKTDAYVLQFSFSPLLQR